MPPLSHMRVASNHLKPAKRRRPTPDQFPSSSQWAASSIRVCLSPRNERKHSRPQTFISFKIRWCEFKEETPKQHRQPNFVRAYGVFPRRQRIARNLSGFPSLIYLEYRSRFQLRLLRGAFPT
ncbi:hypothetical protein V2G26_015311 [Clonostachys chloroleuca]